MAATAAKKTKAAAAKAPAKKARTVKAAPVKARTVKAAPAKAGPAKARAAKVSPPRAAAQAKAKSTATLKSAAGKTADLSEDVFTSVEAGQRAALAAVRKFVDTVDDALPALGAHPSRRETVIDAALDMADKLVTTQYQFLRSVVRSADRSLRLSDRKRK